MFPRLRESRLLTAGRKFTQPREHSLAGPSIMDRAQQTCFRDRIGNNSGGNEEFVVVVVTREGGGQNFLFWEASKASSNDANRDRWLCNSSEKTVS